MESKDNIEKLNQAAANAYKESNFKQAIIYYKSALEIDNSDDLIHNNISICYRNINDIKRALHHINYAIKLNPNYSLYYSTKSTILVKEHLLKEALEAIDMALMFNNDKEFLMNKISILRKLKEFKKAIKIIDSLLEQSKNDTDLNCYKAILLYETNQFEESKNIFQSLVGSDSDSIAKLYIRKIGKLN